MPRSRRSSGSVANSAADIDPPELYQWRSLFATFLKEASPALGSPYFWLVRTNGWKSLCLLTGLPPMDYGILLHQCQIIYIVNYKDGTREVKMDVDKFNTFLREYGVRGDPKLQDGCAELSNAHVTQLALKRNERDAKRTQSDNNNNNDEDKDDRVTLHVLRVGKIPRGARPPKSTAINNGEEPPRINRRMYNAKNNLAAALHKKLLMHYIDPELVEDGRLLRDWVLMKKKPTQVVVPPTPQHTTNPSTDNNNNDKNDDKQPLPSPGDTDGPDSPDTTCDTPARPTKRANTASTPNTISNPKQSADDATIDTKSKDNFDITFDVDIGKLPEVVRKQFPVMTSTNTPDQLDTWDDQKQEQFWNEYEALKERFNQPDIPDDVRKQFPCLAKMAPGVTNRGERIVAGIDLDRQWMEGMLRESVQVAEQHNEPLQYTHENGKHAVRLLQLPMSKDNEGKVKPNIKKCMDQLLDVVGNEYKDEVVDLLLEYLITKHKDKTLDTLREKQMIPNVMDEFDVAALVDQSNIKIWQWRSIQQCLKLFMGIQQIGVSETKLRALGADHGEITHGTYHYTDPANPDKVKEEVRYWYKDVVFEFIQAVEGIINGYELDPELIEFIHIAHGGDHGKEKFRFASKLVVKMKDGTYYDDVFGLADVACKKDHAIILDNTVLPPLMEGINIIEDSDLVFNSVTSADGTSTLSIDMVKSNRHVSALSIKPTSFMVGDLAFLAVMMGKPNFSGAWCCWCKLTKDEWQNASANVDVDLLWDMAGIIEQAASNVENGFGVTDKSDPRMMGVRNAPKSNIPFKRHIFSVLHAGIGIGNRIVKELETFIDLDIEHITPEEFQKRTERDTALDSLSTQRILKGVWMNSHQGGKAIGRKRNRVKTLERQLKTNITAEQKREKTKEQKKLRNDITQLVKKRDKYSKEISRLEKVVNDSKEELRKFTKSRRGAEESIYTQVDRIFQSIGANRAHYFGRKFEGVDIRKIMAKSDYLFGEDGKIRKLLLEHASDDNTKEAAKKVCEDVGLAFELWDGVFSYVHKVDPTDEHCDKTQERINQAMEDACNGYPYHP